MTLAERQNRLAEALAGPAEPPALDLIPAGTLSARAALEVYRAGYVARLTEALAETFAGTARLLGDELFRAACAHYIGGRRSPFYNLSDYGAGLWEVLAERDAGWAELARFEWEFKALFHLPAPKPLAPERLAAAGPGTRFVFITASRLLRHEAAVYRFWSRQSQRLEPGPERVALVKQGLDIVAYELGEREFEIVGALREGRTVEQAISLEGLDEAVVAKAFAFLREGGIVEAAL